MNYRFGTLSRLASIGLVLCVVPFPRPSGQDATFCSSLKRIAAAAPERWKDFDVGEVRIGGGAAVLPGARRSSLTLSGATACRILTYNGVTSHSCYFRALSADEVWLQANSIARIVGRCLGKGEALPREAVDGEYRLIIHQSGGLDYVVKVRPKTTISVELNLRPSIPARPS